MRVGQAIWPALGTRATMGESNITKLEVYVNPQSQRDFIVGEDLPVSWSYCVSMLANGRAKGALWTQRQGVRVTLPPGPNRWLGACAISPAAAWTLAKLR